jgi:probable HAF family extracellular repeat protein
MEAPELLSPYAEVDMNRHNFAASLIGLLLLVPAGASVNADGARYVVENLGMIDGLVPTVTGMNASGQISGYVFGAAGLRAVRYDAGAWSYVPRLESVYSAATAINVHGDLAGYQLTSSGMLAFRYSDGVGVSVIPALPGGSFGIGMAINANGDVVGYGDVVGSTRAWIARPGARPIPLPTLGGTFSLACGVNDSGQITGSGTTSGNYQHAFRVDPDGSIVDLSTFDGVAANSTACAIDADGRVGGQSSSAGNPHAFLFAAGNLVDLDSFASSSFSTINSTSDGVSVGFFVTVDGTQHAIVHTDADGSSDLNNLVPADSGWVLAEASTVNSKGQIAGAGTFGGVPAAFRLTPVPGDTTPPVINSFSATPSSVTPPNKAMVAVAISATATDDQDPNPVCAVTAVDGHGAPAADSAITGALAGSVRATGGSTYSFTVTCHDATGNAASRDVDVVVPPDTTAPSIASVTASPSRVWPPDGAMVPVTVSVRATDDSGEAPVCSLAWISSRGAGPDDSSVTGPFTGLVRAVGGRTYSLRVACSDAAGNTASSAVDVVVPPDTTAPAITSLTASPSRIWPPNGKMVSVAVSVDATDDVDATPRCALTAIVGGSSADAVITGAFAANVRANKDAVYTLQVICSDRAGNKSRAGVNVIVLKDAPSADARKREEPTERNAGSEKSERKGDSGHPGH